MKQVILSVASMMMLSVGHSQWSYKMVNNGFDDPYKVAYTAVNDGAILKLEKVEDRVAFYIIGRYYCEDYPIVDLVFVVNGQDIKFYCEATKGNDNETVFIIDDILTSNALDAFKNCSLLKVRINESYCDTETYFFNMKGSTAALNYIKSE